MTVLIVGLIIMFGVPILATLAALLFYVLDWEVASALSVIAGWVGGLSGLVTAIIGLVIWINGLVVGA